MTSRLVHLTVPLLAAACGSRVESAAARNDSVGRFDSVAAVAAAGMDDASALGLLDAVHASDSAAGALAAARASTADVRDFGRMITREHHALRRDAVDVAKTLGLVMSAPRQPPDAPPAAMREALESDSATSAWDRRYLDYAIALHRSAMENAARALAASTRPEVRRYIEATVPIVQKHLDKALALAKAMDARRTSGAR